MTTKKPNTPSDDDDFFDDDLFDSDLFDGKDDDVVVRGGDRSREQDDDEEDALFDSMISEQVERPVARSARAVPAEFEEDHTEVIVDDDHGPIPNTYLTDDKGKVYNVTRTPFLIGRSKECDLVINVKGVSRKHAELTYGNGHFILRDLDSLNGTRVNGTPLPQTRLQDADVIKFGRQQLSFFTDTTGASRTHKPMQSFAERQKLERQRTASAAKAAVAPEPVYESRSTDWLIKLNFVVVAFIILMTVTYVIWEDMQSEDVVAPVNDMQNMEMNLPPLPGDEDLLTVGENDWTKTGELPEGDEEIREIAQAVEAQMKGTTGLRLEPRKPRVAQSERQLEVIEKDSESIRQSVRESEQKEAAEKARMEEQKLLERSANETAEAKGLLNSISQAYLSGDQLSTKIKRMDVLSKSNVLNSRIKRDLANTHQMYIGLIEQYNAGEKLYESGAYDAAFREWQSVLNEEKAIVGDNKSFFSRQISERVIERTIERAEAAVEREQIGEAIKLYQKLAQLKPEGQFKAKIEELLREAEKTFEKADQIMAQDPEQAVSLLQSVMNATPRDHPLHIRAEAKLVWLKEGLK